MTKARGKHFAAVAVGVIAAAAAAVAGLEWNAAVLAFGAALIVLASSTTASFDRDSPAYRVMFGRVCALIGVVITALAGYLLISGKGESPVESRVALLFGGLVALDLAFRSRRPPESAVRPSRPTR